MKLKAKSHLFDTHAHVNFNAFKEDADEVIKRSLKEGVFVVNVGSQYSTSKRAVEMAHKYESGVWAAVGLHPIQLQKRTIDYVDDNELDPAEIKTVGEEFEYAVYLELAKDEKVVAIGEVGLDYKHFDPPRVDDASPRVEAGEGDDIPTLIEKQKTIFLEFIKIANEVAKPIIIHCWGNYAETKAYDDILDILQKNPVKKAGIIHSFMGSRKTAKKFTELGYKIGLNGVITYSESYDRLIKEINLEDIVLETDCPYLTPVPHKGERNEPAYVKLVAEKIASVKEISAEEVAKKTTISAQQILAI
jgi:TatD DNase family protein